MNKRVEAIVDQVRQLTPEEQGELLDRLVLASEAADGTPEEVESAWAAEVERRIRAVERGESQLNDHVDVMAHLRGLLTRK